MVGAPVWSGVSEAVVFVEDGRFSALAIGLHPLLRQGAPMYKHILIPTDGSALSEMAIRQGVALAKSLNAKVTGLTVSPTFHTFAVEPMIITDTPEQYRNECDALAA